MKSTPIERAFQIADDAMYELLESEGVPGDEHRTVFGFTNESCHEVSSLAEASTAMQEAFEWLSQRGYVELGTDGTGEFVQVLTRPSDEGYAGVPGDGPAVPNPAQLRAMARPSCMPGRHCERYARGLGGCVAGHCYPPAAGVDVPVGGKR